MLILYILCNNWETVQIKMKNKIQNDDAQKLENNINESISKYVQNIVGDESSIRRTTGNYSKGNRLKLTRRDKLKE